MTKIYRTCKKCWERKELIANFYPYKKYWKWWCKKCELQEAKQYRKDNSDKIKEIKKRCYQNRNKDEYNKTIKKWQIKNKKHIKEYKEKYNKENKNKIKEYNKKYKKKNKEILKRKRKIYLQKNKDKIVEYLQKNKKEINKKRCIYEAKTLIEEPKFKLRKYISHSIRSYLQKNNYSKNNLSILNFLPYTIKELKIHIESQFEEWMNWDNYGQYILKEWDDNNPSTWKWQLDHIIPHSEFYYTSMEDEEFQKCWALSNLRPLSAKQNILDGVTRIRHKK